ncbi:LOG family protein [bacterium]|nr:LOG family protein [bacterium]
MQHIEIPESWDKTVAVFGGSDWDVESDNWTLGIEIGRLLGRLGLKVVNGGYSGCMEAVSIGAKDTGSTTIGVLHTSPEEKQANDYIDEYILASDYLDRMRILMSVPIAVVLPGKSGTLAEAAASYALLKRNPERKLMIFAPYWEDKLRPMFEQFEGNEILPEGLHWFNDPVEL